MNIKERIITAILNLIPDKIYLQYQYYKRFGKFINFNTPVRFTEKIQCLKIKQTSPYYAKFVDKVKAKEYVASIIGSQHVIPTLYTWDSAKDIDFNLLPDRFVLKTNHDSGGVLIVKDKSKINIKECIAFLEYHMNQCPYARTRETPYKYVERKILAESYMENAGERDLVDYKFFCFSGEAKYCQVIKNRSDKETIDFFDRSWQIQDFIGLNTKATHSKFSIERPSNYGLMLSIADKLSAGFPFVRVDLYEIEQRVYFGEMTFFPASGFGEFSPECWDENLGRLINID